MRVLHSNKRIRVFWHCPNTAVAGKYDVSFSCQQVFLLLFCKGECKLAVNRHQGIYDNGKVLPQVYRERVLDLHHQGFSQRQISQNMRVSVRYVNKVVQFYENNNSSLAAPRTTPVRNKMSAYVVEYLESEKLCKPSMYTSELQQRLFLDGVSPPGQLPSTSAIKKCIREDCRMTKKKVSQVPKESLSQENTEYTVHLLFQPAYSSHLNTCEFCFHQVKCYLKQNSSLTADETKLAIGEAVSKISPANSIAYFRKCGHV